jgi:hypothetical protein
MNFFKPYLLLTTSLICSMSNAATEDQSVTAAQATKTDASNRKVLLEGHSSLQPEPLG